MQGSIPNNQIDRFPPYERVTPHVSYCARVSCIMDLFHGIYFESFGIAGPQDDVHMTDSCSKMFHAMFHDVL